MKDAATHANSVLLLLRETVSRTQQEAEVL
jgi:hypothetical protein